MTKVDAKGVPITVNTSISSPHVSTLVELLVDFMATVDSREELIGDKAYESDRLDAAMGQLGVEMISPHRTNRKPENKTQDGGRCGATSDTGRWSARLDGFSTTGVLTSDAKDLLPCSKDSFV